MDKILVRGITLNKKSLSLTFVVLLVIGMISTATAMMHQDGTQQDNQTQDRMNQSMQSQMRQHMQMHQHQHQEMHNMMQEMQEMMNRSDMTQGMQE